MGFSSQELFAKALGIDQPRVAKWESGSNMPSAKYRPDIMRALDVDESFFEHEQTSEVTRADLIISITSGLASLDKDELAAVWAAVESRLAARGARPGGG